MKKDIFGALLIGIGLSLIFGYASHTWYGGVIVGACFFIGSVLVITRKRKYLMRKDAAAC